MFIKLMIGKLLLWGHSCLQKTDFSKCRLKLAIVTKVTGGGEAGVCANSKLKASTSLRTRGGKKVTIKVFFFISYFLIPVETPAKSFAQFICT